MRENVRGGGLWLAILYLETCVLLNLIRCIKVHFPYSVGQWNSTASKRCKENIPSQARHVLTDSYK